MKHIIYYHRENNIIPYLEWYESLDLSISARVDQRIDKLRKGLYGDHKRLQKTELSELRMDFGAGYRIYYYDLDSTIVLFVAGSSKKNQEKTIQLANAYLKDFKERNDLI